MNVGGFQPMTLSDFPGMTAAIVFTQGCNFRCPFCHNGLLLEMKRPMLKLMDIQKLFNELKRRKIMLDGLVITGGEPTIQPNLLPFIKAVRNMGYKIKLDTNGSCPEVIDKLISHNVLDYIAMDVKAPLDKYRQLAGVEVVTENIIESISIISKADVASEFRTTYVPQLLTKTDIESIHSLIPVNCKYTLQKFIPENALGMFLRKTSCSEGKEINV